MDSYQPMMTDDQITDGSKTNKFVDFIRDTKEQNAQWKELGLLLCLDKAVLDTIQYDNPRDLTACRVEMLHAWLKTNPANPKVMLDNALKEIQRTTRLRAPENHEVVCWRLDDTIATEIHCLKDEYAAIATEAYHCLLATDMSAAVAAVWLNEILRGTQSEPLIIERAVSNYSDLFEQMQKKWSFTNPTLLQQLVKNLKDNSLIQKLAQYTERFNTLCNKFPIRKLVCFEPNEPSQELVIISNFDTFDDINVFLRDAFDIYARYLRVHMITPADSKQEVTVQFPPSMVTLFQDCIHQRREAASIHIEPQTDDTKTSETQLTAAQSANDEAARYKVTDMDNEPKVEEVTIQFPASMEQLIQTCTDTHITEQQTEPSVPTMPNATATTITLERAAERSGIGKQVTGYLRGVDVHGETVLEVVGDKPQKLKWPGYGFYIEVPEGALPPGVTASVGVKVILGGQFTFPENRQLISAIYAVTCSEVFLKEVTVNIQHCAAITTGEQCSMCRFIIAKCTQEILPYRFREREGVFNLHTQYGAVKLKRFSLIGQTASDDTDLKCTALMYYKEQIPNPLVIDFHFVVVKNLKPYLQRATNDYQMKGWRNDESNSFTIFFSSNTTIQLDLLLDEQKIDPWRILPLVSPPQVSSDDVSNFEAGQRIPHCSYELQLLPGKPFQRLLHKVALIGVSSPNSFHIRYPQPEENKAHSTSTSPPASPRDESELSNTLDISNIYKVKLALRNVSNNWQNLGLALGLSYQTLRSIRTTERDIADQCMREMIAAWLAKKDNVSRIGTPSWSVLQAALREVGENEVADRIRLRNQFPSSSTSQSMD